MNYPNPISGCLSNDGEEVHASGGFYKQFLNTFHPGEDEAERVQRKIVKVINHPYGSTEEKVDDLIVKLHCLCAAIDHISKNKIGDRADWMALQRAREVFTI